MLLEKFKESNLLFNANFLEAASEAGLFGYRGEWVLIEGGIGDAKGHAKPPEDVLRGAVLLADEKLKMVIGALDRLASLQTLVEKYANDFAPDMQALLYVVDIKEPVVVELEGASFILIPLVQGVPWNEAVEELGMEKSDFKGQSPADKIATLYEELKGYQPKYKKVGMDEALEATTDAVREVWGAV